MKIDYARWAMTQWSQEPGERRTTQIRYKTHGRFTHEGHECNEVVVSFAATESEVDIEVLAAMDGQIVSAVSLAEHLEQDDLFLVAARAITAEVVRGTD